MRRGIEVRKRKREDIWMMKLFGLHLFMTWVEWLTSIGRSMNVSWEGFLFFVMLNKWRLVVWLCIMYCVSREGVGWMMWQGLRSSIIRYVLNRIDTTVKATWRWWWIIMITVTKTDFWQWFDLIFFSFDLTKKRKKNGIDRWQQYRYHRQCEAVDTSNIEIEKQFYKWQCRALYLYHVMSCHVM